MRISAAGPTMLSWRPARRSSGSIFTDSRSPPSAADRKPARVTPTCAPARNRFGSLLSSATIRPRRPRGASAAAWLSRNETSEISAATKIEAMMMKVRTTPTETSVSLTRTRISAMHFPTDVPTLSAGPVTLRAARADDADGVVEQCHDPLSIRWTTVPLGYAREDALDFLTRHIPEGWRTGSAYTFVVDVTGDDGVPRFAGTISLRDEGDRRAEVAYGAHPRARGRGAMVTAVRLLLEWGFAERELLTVVWWANSGNWASRKLAWRLGFSFGGELRQWLPQRGELVDGWVGTLRVGDPMEPSHPWFDVPRIVGSRVVMRRTVPEDLPRMVEGAADPVLKQWLGQFPQPYRLAHAEEFVAFSLERQARGEGLDWTLADPD